jgi:hypothetical protein
MPELGCTQIVEDRERDNNGKLIIFHRLCGRPATEVVLSGHLTKAKAILCEEHLRQATRHRAQPPRLSHALS